MTATLPRSNRTSEGATSIVKFHASLNVSNLDRSLEFYAALFGEENSSGQRIFYFAQTVRKPPNLITGRWAADVYALKRPGGRDEVIRPPIDSEEYFQRGPYNLGREHYRWPEKLLALATNARVRLRGARGGMFFVDRRKAYAEQIEARTRMRVPDIPVPPL